MTITICETCGSASREERSICADCGEPIPPREDIRRLPHGVVQQFLEDAEEFLAAVT